MYILQPFLTRNVPVRKLPLLVLPRVLHHVRYLVRRHHLAQLLLPRHVPENQLLFVLLKLNKLFGLGGGQFGEVDVPVPVVEGGNDPVSGFVVVLGLGEDLLDLVLGEEHVANAGELFDFNLLDSNGVEEFFFFPFMFLLDVLQFLHVLDVFLLYFPKPDSHFFHLLIQGLVVFFH